MGRKRSEISMMPFNQSENAMGALLPVEAQFYSQG
jgi:hypothetical protein